MAAGYSTPRRPLIMQRGGLEESNRRFADTQEKKRLRQSPSDSINECARCCNDFSIRCEYLHCGGCMLKFCLRCTELSRAVYECICNGDLLDYQWKCKACKTMTPTLQHINEVLNDIQSKQEKRLTNIEVRLDKIEIGNKTEIEYQCKEVKDTIVDEIHKDVEKMVDERSKEWNDRRRREVNIMVFNLQEGTHATGEENKEEDIKSIKEITTCLGIENLEIVTLYRIGNKQEGKVRGLKVILADRTQRKKTLDMARHIPQKVKDQNKKVVITKDMTPKEREESKAKRQNKRRNDQPKSTIGVQSLGDNLMDINLSMNLSPIHTIQNVFDNIQSAIDAVPESPTISENNQLIGNPYLSDARNSPNDVTVIGGVDMLHARNSTNDVTVIGGVDMAQQIPTPNPAHVLNTQPTSPDVMRE